MPQENKYITSSTNEFEFGKIITNRIVFAIPYFQRSYVWNKENLEEFHTDILELEDNSNNIAFMGAIILYRRPEYQATQATFYDVIDGQQRIITMTLYIIALADKYVQLREFEKAAEVLQVLFNTGRTSLPSNIKIYPCGKDIPQFNNILKRLFQNPRLSEAMEIVPKYLPDHEGGSTRGKLATQYGRIKQKVGKYETIERLEELTSFLTDKVNFVQLDLNEPNDATKVFERLNFRGVQVTVGDLVRNEIFVDSYTTPPDELTQIYLEHWIPFYQRFGSNEKDFESFLFGSALIHDSTINKSGIYTLLRGEWEDFEFPSEKIEFLKKYLEEFCEIKYGNSHKDFSQRIKDSLNLLRTAKVADVVHPFLMK
ncbi:MAG: DUF262 domain-containing protein, partial [SAR202 cluster bacterium]|nr:DUF262 domain-containing protein [SAR202 cluster bacterium]